MLAIFVALGVMLIAGLIAIPTIQQAALANKGGTSNENAEPIRSSYKNDAYSLLEASVFKF